MKKPEPPHVISCSPEALNKWNECINEVRWDVNALSVTDSTILERYCLTYADYVELQLVRQELRNKGWDKIKTFHAVDEINLESHISKKAAALTTLEKALINILNK